MLVSAATTCALALTLSWTSGSESGTLPTTAWISTQIVTDSAAWPVAGFIYRFPEIPWPNWNSGHRGIDIQAELKAPVYAPMPGVVSWAGDIAGNSGITISDENGYRHTLMHIVSELSVGEMVTQGQEIGQVGQSDHCGFEFCVHWSVRLDDRYLDPRWLVAQMVVLLP